MSTHVYDQILHRQGTSQLRDLIAKLVYVLEQSKVNTRSTVTLFFFTPVFQLFNYYYIILSLFQTDLNGIYYVDQVGIELVV